MRTSSPGTRNAFSLQVLSRDGQVGFACRIGDEVNPRFLCDHAREDNLFRQVFAITRCPASCNRVRDLNTKAVLNWRKRFRERLELIAARYPPKSPVDLDDLADMLSVIADGGIILSRVVNDKQALPRQIMLYRDFIRAVFLGSC